MKKLFLAAGLTGLMELTSAVILIRIVNRKMKILEKKMNDGDTETLIHVNEAFKIHEKSYHTAIDA